MNKERSFMIIAGEISGDMHAAPIVHALKNRYPNATFLGMGGSRMRDEGVDTEYDVKDLAVMGFVEVMRKYSFFKRVFDEMTDIAWHKQPDAVILVDYPGFNLRLAKKLKAMDIKVIYYICPQVWAWNQARIPMMAKIVDRLITIFPFEKKYFSDTDLKVDFAGHPLVDESKKSLSEPLRDLPWKGKPEIALLPGSRTNEINKLLPAMWGAAKLIEKKHPSASFIIPAPSENIKDIIEKKIASLPDGPTEWKIVSDETHQVLRQAKAAMVASGTATIDTALMGCPMIITYKMSFLTYLLGRLLVKVDNIGMVNIVAGKEICPEFIQGAVTAKTLADAIEPLIQDTEERKSMIEDLKKVSASLGDGNAAEKAADIIINEIEG